MPHKNLILTKKVLIFRAFSKIKFYNMKILNLLKFFLKKLL
jgi:hypothetical protein